MKQVKFPGKNRLFESKGNSKELYKLVTSLLFPPKSSQAKLPLQDDKMKNKTKQNLLKIGFMNEPKETI